nr:XRE family transcriptional regulator [uncultured Lachnoanaerobaculum sp.]
MAKNSPQDLKNKDFFSRKFNELLNKHGKKQADISRDLSIPKSTLTGYVQGTSLPTAGNVQKLADYFNVKKSDLDLRFANMSKLQDTKDSLPIKAVKIPVLGDVAAGIPIEAVESILDYEEIDEELASKGEFFGLRIKGNSMAPRIQSGDVVIVRVQSDAESGDIVIAKVNGDDACCKKLQKHDEGISLISLNPEYEPMFFSKKDIADLPVHIIGKVVELRGKF